MMTKYCEACLNPYPVKNRFASRRACNHKCWAKVQMRDAVKRRQPIMQPTGDYRLLPLANGGVTKVSVEDYQDLSNLPWFLTSDKYVANSYEHRLSRVVMSRVLGVPDIAGDVVDHINGDTFDNRRSNLRFITSAQNLMNRPKNRNNSSGYKGVHRHVNLSRPTPKNESWRVVIVVDEQPISAGRFTDPAYAASIYDQYAIELHGEYARLNFAYL